MAGASGEQLAAEVTRAGGFGFMYPGEHRSRLSHVILFTQV